MEAPATRFQREVDPEDEGREVTLNENLATVKNLTICLWTACVAKTHHLFCTRGTWGWYLTSWGGRSRQRWKRTRGQTIKSIETSRSNYQIKSTIKSIEVTRGQTIKSSRIGDFLRRPAWCSSKTAILLPILFQWKVVINVFRVQPFCPKYTHLTLSCMSRTLMWSEEAKEGARGSIFHIKQPSQYKYNYNNWLWKSEEEENSLRDM